MVIPTVRHPRPSTRVPTLAVPARAGIDFSAPPGNSHLTPQYPIRGSLSGLYAIFRCLRVTIVPGGFAPLEGGSPWRAIPHGPPPHRPLTRNRSTPRTRPTSRARSPIGRAPSPASRQMAALPGAALASQGDKFLDRDSVTFDGFALSFARPRARVSDSWGNPWTTRVPRCVDRSRRSCLPCPEKRSAPLTSKDCPVSVEGHSGQ